MHRVWRNLPSPNVVEIKGYIEGKTREELLVELATLQAPATLPKPKGAIIKAVLENAVGRVLSVKTPPYLAALL